MSEAKTINLNDAKFHKELLNDLKSCEWHIVCDATGQIALEEI